MPNSEWLRAQRVPTNLMTVKMSGDASELIAFYLPQYHPIRKTTPSGDAGSRSGPTSPGWCLASSATTGLDCRLISDSVTLRVPETPEAQAALAREYGVTGFCHYHYWCGGRRLLERPFDEVLASKRPDFPFCLCWANEPWTRWWDGRDGHVLVDQILFRAGRLGPHPVVSWAARRRPLHPARGETTPADLQLRRSPPRYERCRCGGGRPGGLASANCSSAPSSRLTPAHLERWVRRVRRIPAGVADGGRTPPTQSGRGRGVFVTRP